MSLVAVVGQPTTIPRMAQSWDGFLTVPMKADGVQVLGKTFVPMTDQLISVQIVWALGPHRVVRVIADQISDQQRANNPNYLGELVDRPSDLGAETHHMVDSDLAADLRYVGIPSRPTGYIWFAQEPLNCTWLQFVGRVIAQQSINSPDPRDDTDTIALLLDDLKFAD